MAENFYVPYEQIKFFTQKDEGVYRHVLSFRIYLYLCHYHSGRIKWDDRKHLVQQFNSSHTAVKKALEYLDLINFVKIDKGWITANGQKQVHEILEHGVGRIFNIEFLFDLNILANAKKFANHLFLCIFQSSAMIRGRKKKVLIPQKNHTNCMLENGQNENSGNEFIQKQSLTYLAKMTERHPQTIFKRNQGINAENHYLTNSNPKRTKTSSGRTALTKDGFNTREYSQIIGFRDQIDATNYLTDLKKTDSSFNPCYVMEANHGGYVIVKHIPDEYLFNVKTKKSFKNYNEDFSVFQTLE